MSGSELRQEDYEFIPEEEVPQRQVQYKWAEFFDMIPVGQAVILDGKKNNRDKVRAALKRLQKINRYLDYSVAGRTIEGKKKTYVIHHKK